MTPPPPQKKKSAPKNISKFGGTTPVYIKTNDTQLQHVIFFKWLQQPFLFSMDSSQKLIRSTEIPREPTLSNLNAIQPMAAHKLFAGYLGKWPF